MGILLENETKEQIDLNLLEKILKELSNEEVEVIITDNENIKKLNKRYRNEDKPTDVLSFPLKKIPHAPIGSIVISMDKVKEKAKELNHSIEEETALLFLHGLLHLLGYDHEKDEGEMREKEEEIIKKLSLPKSLIVRNG